MAKGIKRKLEAARANVSQEISGDYAAAGGSRFAVVVSEGFNGGYRAALDDVMLALNGVTPQRNGWWRDRRVQE